MTQNDEPRSYVADAGPVGRHAGFREPVNFHPGAFIPNDPSGFREVMDLAHYRGMVLAVGFFQDNGTWNTVEGSAVMIGHGIVATATHVFDELAAQIKKSQLRMLFSAAVDGHLRIWYPRTVHPCNGTDVSIIEVELISEMPEERSFAQAILTTRLPAVGDTVMLVGFRSSERYIGAEKGVYFPTAEGKMQMGLSAFCSVGRVTQHNLGNTASITPGLTITTDCKAVGGMSGGPAFDQHGRVFGILSASVNSPDQPPYSTVSLLAQALAVRAHPAFVPGYFNGDAPALLHSGHIVLEGRERASIDGETLKIEW